MTIREEASITIQRPVDEVFAFVADQTNAPRWQQGLLEVKRTTLGPPGVGTRHAFVRKFMGRRVEGTSEYVEFEPGKKVRFTGNPGSATSFEGTYLTQAADDGTKVTSVVEFDPEHFLIGLAEPLVAAGLRRDIEADLSELKELMEGHKR